VQDGAIVTPNRRLAIFLAGSAVAVAVVVIALLLPATNPTTGKGQAGKAQKTHTPEQAITVQGTIQKTTAADGKVAYTLVANGTTYHLSDGPEWWWGANDPLASYVGRTVDVTGEVAQGSTDIDVLSVDGKALRAPGRPPWAGGPKAVGEKHPGFKAAKEARDKAKDKGSGKPGASAAPSSSASPPPSSAPSASPR
jgi:hypothetical protein